MANSSTTFALAQAGSFTVGGSASPGPVPQGFVVTNAAPVRRRRVQRTTGSRDVSGTWTQDTHHIYVQGVPTREFQFEGYIENAAVYGSIQDSTLTIQAGNVTIFPYRVELRKRWPLQPVTGSASGNDAEWVWGIPEFSFRGDGWVEGSAPGLDATQERITISADELGTIEWNTADTAGKNDGTKLQIEQTSESVPLSQGGGVPYRFSGLFQKNVSYSAGNNDWSWLFSQTGGNDDPQKVDLTLDPGNGNTDSHSTLVYDVRLRWGFTQGGSTEFRARARFDRA